MSKKDVVDFDVYVVSYEPNDCTPQSVDGEWHGSISVHRTFESAESFCDDVAFGSNNEHGYLGKFNTPEKDCEPWERWTTNRGFRLVIEEVKSDSAAEAQEKDKHHNDEFLSKSDYKSVLLAQDACNLSGVARTLSKLLDKIWLEAHHYGRGTDWVNTHPAVVLLTNKMSQLSGSETMTGFNIAYDHCTKRAGDD